MLSNKRKLPFTGLGRRVRPRREDEQDPELEESENESGDDEGNLEGQENESEQEEIRDSASDASPSPPPEKSRLDVSAISFGALARAQASIPTSGHRRKKGDKESPEASNDDSDPDSRRKPINKGRPTIESRTSKHAPTEMSSKRQVSRKREVIIVPKIQARDPRFDPLSTGGGRFDEAKAQKAYAFLDEYRDDEMKQLKDQIKKTKNPAAKETLQRTLMSMASKKKSRDRKEHEQKIIEEHRAKEKELVKQGKKPFYLKKSEQKKRVLLDQFAGMKKKQVDRAIERKRKKIAGKEKKELGQLERVRSRD